MSLREIRKCAFTKRPISPQDKSSVVYTIGELDANGRYTGKDKIVSVCGAVRKDGHADMLLYTAAKEEQ
ncbi:small subunit ribosomal protein S21e [Nematocida homosporus]|uniref:small subunit ribosomal protein S21e n=1 Tax=Nematocida homosporus TaxID=1912981 RepID=UPI002220B9F8|nr:small subunit ribosomal protein S21e [Nematocida homosporus]KAI5184509.1 small subunit ribosomal protein S21e [Nematocida homosporus]